MWSGPGWAGGQILDAFWMANQDPSGAVFRRLYGDTTGGKTAYGISPLGFLDAALWKRLTNFVAS